MKRTSQEKLDIIISSYESRPRKNGNKEDETDVQYFIKESVPEDVHAILSEAARSLAIHSLDMTHEIMDSACSNLAYFSLKEIERYEPSELSEYTANVYMSTQLSYLDIWNQEGITEIVRETGCDIATSAAIWYERQVAEAIDALKQYIFKD